VGEISIELWSKCGGSSHFLNLKATSATSVQVCYTPAGFQEVDAPRFLHNRYTKVVRLSALRTGRLYLPGNIFVLEAESTPGPQCGRKDHIN